MEMKIKSQVQFNDDLSQRSNIVSGDSLSNSFAKIHHDLNDYEIAANIAANDRPKNLLYIHDILSDSVSTATEEILGYSIEAGTYVYSAEIYTVQNPSVANVTKIEFLGADGNTVVGTCNITCDTKKEEHINVTLSDEAYYIKYYRDTYSSETVGYLKTSKQMICLPNVYAAFPEYTMYAPSLGETFLEVEDSVKTYDVQDTYDSSSYKAISGKGVAAALGTLDVSSVGGSGKYISAISEENGKISATETTMDTTPTANSTVPVTSGGVATDQARQEVEIGAVANRGAKNLFKNTAVSKTYLGVRFTVNEDGTVSLSGAATTAVGVLEIGTVTLPAGSYIVSGCPEGGSWAPNPNKYRIRVAKNGAWLCDETGTGYTVTVNGSDVISLQINSGVGVDTAGLVFKPMIRPASITDQTFVPYAKTNRELTVAEDEDRAAILLLSQLNGAHNLLDIINIEKIKTLNPTATWNDRTMTLGGVDWEFKIDGSILVNGTAGTNGSYPIFAYLTLPIDKYVMSGGSPTVKFTAFTIGSDAGSGYLLNVTSQTTQPIEFIGNISANVTVTNVTIRPMITTLDVDTMDDRFFPYSKTNRELTVENVSQQSEINYVVNTGVKNFLDVQRPTATTRTSYTPLANGGVKLSCSNATWTSYAIADIPVEAGKEYVITFLLDESSGTSNFYFFLRNGDSSGTNLATKNYGNTTGNYEASFTPSNSIIWLGIYLNNSATAATATAKLRCMIRPSSITDSTFQPYALPNPTLTPAAIKAVDEGAKNLLGYSNTSLQSLNSGSWNNNVLSICGVEITVNNDNSIVINGTATAGIYFRLTSTLSQSLITNEVYVLSGCKNGAASTYGIYTGTTGQWDNYSGGTEKVYQEWNSIYIFVRSGVAMSNVLFKPMICTAADWAVSQKFVPYAPTNRELYETKITMVDVFGLGKALTSGDDMDSLSLGHFACTNATIAGTVSHAPWSDSGFFGWTMTSIQTDRFVQIAIKNSDDFQIAKRRYSGTWSNWVYSITTSAST